jgi:hypothetical protein
METWEVLVVSRLVRSTSTGAVMDIRPFKAARQSRQLP